MRFAVWTFVVALFSGASAFRVKPKRRGQDKRRAAPQIDGVFPFAAAGVAEPALQNPRGGPCFPGVRAATVSMRWYGQEADTATTVTGVLGYRHPWMDIKLIDLNDRRRDELYTCRSEGEETGNRPRGLPKSSLHDRNGYAAAMMDLDLGWGDLFHKLTNIGIPESYNLNRTSAHVNAQQFGWDLIGSALDSGGSGYVGESVSHLFQDPNSKECMLTFQGSSSFEDWTANLNIKKVPFCGYAPAGADANSTLAPGQSLVHKGFADALMQMIKNSDWQADVRPKLPSCSKVYVTGHSQGGCEAELFAACVQMAPQVGEDGYDDYKYISW